MQVIFILSVLFNIILVICMVFLLYKLVGIQSVINRIMNLFGNRSNSFQSYQIYENRISLFEELPLDSEAIIFLGDSITQRNEWSELFNNPNIKNRGIDSNSVEGALLMAHSIASKKPAKIFINVGINDIYRKYNQEYVYAKYEELLNTIQTISPGTKIYVCSVLPVNNSKYKHPIDNDNVIVFNNKIKEIACRKKITFVNTYTHMLSKNGKELAENYSFDGVHLSGKGYINLKTILLSYVVE